MCGCEHNTMERQTIAAAMGSLLLVAQRLPISGYDIVVLTLNMLLKKESRSTEDRRGGSRRDRGRNNK